MGGEVDRGRVGPLRGCLAHPGGCGCAHGARRAHPAVGDNDVLGFSEVSIGNSRANLTRGVNGNPRFRTIYSSIPFRREARMVCLRVVCGGAWRRQH